MQTAKRRELPAPFAAEIFAVQPLWLVLHSLALSEAAGAGIIVSRARRQRRVKPASHIVGESDDQRATQPQRRFW